MGYGLLAQIVLVIHVAYILFAVFGGVWGLWWRKAWTVHLPALAWALAVELLILDCPLTSLENRFRIAAGQSGYEAGFLDHFLTSMIYPGLPAGAHIAMGLALAALNLGIYLFLYSRGRLAFPLERYET